MTRASAGARFSSEHVAVRQRARREGPTTVRGAALGVALIAACGTEAVRPPPGHADRAPTTRLPATPEPAPEDIPMQDAPLTITARCRAPGCPLDGDDVFIDITIENRTGAPVEVPVAFLQQSGPVIRLIDTRTRAEVHLRKPPADLELADQRTELPPGGTAQLAWVIHTSELRHFGTPVDVTAEITIAADVVVEGEVSAFTGTASLRIGGG